MVMKKLLFAAVTLCLLAATGALAKETQVFVNPDNPVYTNKAYGFILTLPPGQWGGFLREDGCGVRFSDAADGDEEFTEVRAYAFPRGKATLRQMFDEEVKGYAEILKEEFSPAQDWFAITADSGRGTYVYVKYFLGKDAVNVLAVSSATAQKPTFDYTVPVVTQKFKPGFVKKP